MIRNAALTAVLALCLLAFQGCPGFGSPFVGTWIVTIDGLDRGLELLPNGQTNTFTIDTSFIGTIEWFADGDQLILNQNEGANQKIYSARLSANGDSLAGGFVIWEGTNVGSGNMWLAERM
jgi:hypothetical protein